MLDIKNLKLTTLCENTSTKTGIIGEWGLSILIDDGKNTFLFDTGFGKSAFNNSVYLNINLNKLTAIILSHGHNDHTGGLYDILKSVNKKIPVIAHPGVLEKKYMKKNGEDIKYIGIPHSVETLENFGAVFRLSDELTWLTEDIAVSGKVPMTNSFEKIIGNLFIKKDNDFITDNMEDDQAVYIKTNLGLVVILGCSHRGMINTIKYGQKITKTDKVYLVIGGTHLHKADDKLIENTIEELKNMKTEWLGVSHCTGLKTSIKLANAFKERFFFNNAGSIINFPLN